MVVTEEQFDLVVVGSGGAGLVAALTAAHHGLRAIVLEKAETYGGSTARSGGGLWLPGNEVLRRDGVRDTAEDARAYLAHVAGPDVAPARQHAFLTAAPEMLAFVRAHTPLDFAWVPGYPDYYPEAPGGRALGRSIEPRPLDARLAGEDLATLAAPYRAAPDGVAVTQVDYRWLALGTRHPRAIGTAARLGLRGLAARLTRRRKLTMGQALAAGLRAGLRTAGVPVLLGTPMTELLVDGVRSGSRTFRARRGVLLASGGFEHNEPMRRRYQDIGVDWTVGASGNTGDGIEAGERLGAALDLMDEAWWGPSIPLTGGPYFCLAERNQPGCLMVDGSGRRFVNEAAPYVDAVHAMLAPGVRLPAWLIADRTYRDRYLFAGRGPRAPLPRRWFAAGVAQRADTLDELAARIGVPAPDLRRTVGRFNEFAAHGHDDDFGRGDSAYDRYYGDPRQRPNPCLGAVARPPFYAFRMVPGDLGTKGGLRTDERARVLRPDNTIVPGLYAAGNASATVMGRSYAGAGATLGPAMTFGYLAALDVAGGS
ncbi:3-oxosteroid 1-dehydrogenase [Actinoplanes sp. L3-i22]|uniref:3-oxosteroid 1-dehydrogenase n=1 Tax=Actinoplanes sp. L3-i22 TaxID=2836373 RepID=UPI001C74EDE5|nr:3-oxosteroid 1-dehydrogenase [Actinoplanes sp. L3-i22]BCY13368.1 3-ketosteroid-delta-1-dehydrogenase [Actinoplanes sp. L3-i22]